MKAIIVALSATLTAFVSLADVIVSWGNGATDIVTANSANLPAGTSLNLGSYANPAVGANYYPNYVSEGATPYFYAATDGVRAYVRNATTPGDSLYTVLTVGVGQGAIFLWDKAGFWGGASDAASTVDLTGMTVNITDNAGSTASSVRFVIRLGTDFYVSGTSGEGTTDIADPSTLNWYNYDVANYKTIGSAVTLTDFSNLTAAGLYLTATSTGSSIAISVNNFGVSGTVIPEPATVGLLGLGTLVSLLLRRVRK